MIDQKQIKKVIINGLKEVCQCEVIKANQVGKLPDYPFLSFHIIAPLSSKAGSYAQLENGIKEKEVLQTWSITSQSNSDEDAFNVAIKAFDWLEETGYLILSESGIAVRKLSNISSRDNFITIQYEYRKGFDVTFAFLNQIKESEEEKQMIMESIKFKEN